MLKCTICDYITIHNGHLTRHIKTKHSKNATPDPSTTLTATPSNPDQSPQTPADSVIPKTKINTTEIFHANRNIPCDQPQNSMLNCNIPCNELQYSMPSSDHKCSDCGATFARNYNLIVHQKRCRGVPDHVCRFCKKDFTSIKGRCHHEKICTVLPESHSDEYPKSTQTNPNQTQTATTINNNNGNNYSANNMTNNITNNIQNTINLVSFPLDGEPPGGRLFYIPPNEETQFFQKIKDISRNHSTPLAIEKAILNLLDIAENRILRKKDLKNAITYVHTGNGNWEAQQDRRVYNKVISQATSDIVDALATSSNKPARFIKELDEFSGNAQQFVEEDPSSLTSEEKEAKRYMKNIERTIKIKAHKEYLENGIQT